MTLWDDRILELLRNRKTGTASELIDEEPIRVSRPTVSRRLQKLAEHGLVINLGNGVYQITEKGEGYLDGEVSTYEHEPDEIRDNSDDEGNLPDTASSNSSG